MTKILNLDKVAPAEVRELHIKGVVYEVLEMSVEDFIKTSKLAEAMSENTSFAEQMEASVTLIKMAIPKIDESVLRSMSLEKLAAVSKFVRGEDMEEVETTKEGEAPGKA